MHKPIKYFEKGLTYAAKAAWAVFQRVNKIHQNPSFKPKWADKPLLKSHEKAKPPLGWPRETDSLCPKCVPATRKRYWTGRRITRTCSHEKVGEIKAQIVERDGQIPDGQGLPDPRPLRRRDVDRLGVLQAH